MLPPTTVQDQATCSASQARWWGTPPSPPAACGPSCCQAVVGPLPSRPHPPWLRARLARFAGLLRLCPLSAAHRLPPLLTCSQSSGLMASIEARPLGSSVNPAPRGVSVGTRSKIAMRHLPCDAADNAWAVARPAVRQGARPGPGASGWQGGEASRRPGHARLGGLSQKYAAACLLACLHACARRRLHAEARAPQLAGPQVHGGRGPPPHAPPGPPPMIATSTWSGRSFVAASAMDAAGRWARRADDRTRAPRPLWWPARGAPGVALKRAAEGRQARGRA
jgi:hypothetical protein